MSLPAFRVSFDYRCPFAKNIHLHLIAALREDADFDVTFEPWTLSQGHREAGAPDVWDDSSKEADLIALAYGVAVRETHPLEEFLNAHEALFLARHERGIRLATAKEIEDVLADFEIDLEVVGNFVAGGHAHDIIATTYREFERFSAFGVPTFVVGSDATFVRYMTAPSSTTDSTAIITALVTLMASTPELNEFKHTQLPA